MSFAPRMAAEPDGIFSHQDSGGKKAAASCCTPKKKETGRARRGR